MTAPGIAARVAASDPRGRRLLAWCAGIASIVLALPIVLLIAVVVTLAGQSTSESIGTAGGIPAVYVPMYDAAGAAYDVDPYVLAALHRTESDYSRDPAAFTPNSAGALGPMQFLPETWAHYRSAYLPIASDRPAHYPHECTPHGCITDDFDSIAAAADYLHELGADTHLDERTLNALIRYKGTPPASIPYARETFAIAQELEAANAASGSQAAVGPTTVQRIVAVADEIAAAHIPYCYGGGHVTPAHPTFGIYCHNAANEHISGEAYPGLDCSSAVSMLLQHAGIDTPTLTSSGFMAFGAEGPGTGFTIWANPEHVFVTIDGDDWGTSEAVPYGGPAWAPQTTVGFVARHLPGL